MRLRGKVSLPLMVSAIAVISACESGLAPTIAAVGPVIIPPRDTTPLLISPSSVQLGVGTTAILSTNAPDSLVSRLQWASGDPVIASVAQTGVVTGRAIGTTVIRVRYSFDTLRIATATVTVTPPGTP